MAELRAEPEEPCEEDDDVFIIGDVDFATAVVLDFIGLAKKSPLSEER